MSYISCEGSALIPVVLPPTNSTTAVGSIITPTINVNPVASGALLQPIPATTLPAGRWMVSGIISCDATAGGQTLTGNMGIAKDAVVGWRFTQGTAIDSLSMVLSYIVDSDGTAVITLPTTLTTSGGATYNALASPSSVVQFIRLA